MSIPHHAECVCQPPVYSSQPLTLSDASPERYVELTLAEAVETALSSARVLRDLGATLIRSPAATPSVYDPAIVETNPQVGVEAALSAFDAQYSLLTAGEQFDRPLNNNAIFGGGIAAQVEDNFSTEWRLSKQSAVGTRFELSHSIFYNATNSLFTQFPNSWETLAQASVRHPFWQGGGVDFNRIAGPNGLPGVSRGVLIARTNADISLADFEAGVRNFVSNVENAYWDLYFAYRNLESAKTARNAGRDTWQKVQALKAGGRLGSVDESQARVQFFRFEQAVQDALAGRPTQGTQTLNVQGGGAFASAGGVLLSERRLRLIMGWPINDGALIRPSDSPVVARVNFDWDEAQTHAVANRVELRRQRWVIKRRELELIASRNFLLPRLDLVGAYRWRGLGDDLLQSDNTILGPFDAAYDSLGSGDFQDWQVGVELGAPIGFRRGHAAVRNAELRLSRDRAILRDQERQVVFGVSNALAELDRAQVVATTNYNLLLAARDRLSATQAAFDAEQATLFLVLDAQRDVVSAQVELLRSEVEHALALKNVLFETGSLLPSAGVYLAEGPWPADAVRGAARRTRRSWPARSPLDYVLGGQRVVSRGPHRQTVAVKPVLAPRASADGDADREGAKRAESPLAYPRLH